MVDQSDGDFLGRIGLTPNQMDCLRVISELTTVLGRSPSFREIAHEMDFVHQSAAHRTVGLLQERGWVLRTQSGIRILREPPPIDFDMAGIEILELGRRVLEGAGV